MEHKSEAKEDRIFGVKRVGGFKSSRGDANGGKLECDFNGLACFLMD